MQLARKQNAEIISNQLTLLKLINCALFLTMKYSSKYDTSREELFYFDVLEYIPFHSRRNMFLLHSVRDQLNKTPTAF